MREKWKTFGSLYYNQTHMFKYNFSWSLSLSVCIRICLHCRVSVCVKTARKIISKNIRRKTYENWKYIKTAIGFSFFFLPILLYCSTMDFCGLNKKNKRKIKHEKKSGWMTDVFTGNIALYLYPICDYVIGSSLSISNGREKSTQNPMYNRNVVLNTHNFHGLVLWTALIYCEI